MINHPGVVYLIHFESKLCHARHYVGWTVNLEDRIERHQHDQGSKLLVAVNAANIAWKVVRTWENETRTFERQIKKQKNTARFCPICQAERGK